MKLPFTDLRRQYLAVERELKARIENVLTHGQYIMGPEVQELEEALRVFIGSKHCITVSSGTDALLISLMALGIEPGDEIITTPYSYIATVEVIVRLGAKPVFADIKKDSFNIDIDFIQSNYRANQSNTSS